MAESFIEVTEGSGKKLRANSRTVGANTVHEEVMSLGPQYEASYTALLGASVATAGHHLFEIINGASTVIRIRRIELFQTADATAARSAMDLVRLSTTGTGGSAVTINRHDLADGASAATVNQGVTTGGTVSATIRRFELSFSAAAPYGARSHSITEWNDVSGLKPIVVPASGRVGLRVVAGATGHSVVANVEWTEAAQ